MNKQLLYAGLIYVMTGAVPAADWRDSAWGPDDEIGAANHITPETVLAASKLIKTGKTYNLGIIVDSDTPGLCAALAERLRAATEPDRNRWPGREWHDL